MPIGVFRKSVDIRRLRAVGETTYYTRDRTTNHAGALGVATEMNC
jgi:hypothetical protein